MSRKLFSIILAFVMVLSLSGCGMISLKDDEEEKIAMYSASVVRKYNKGEDQAISFFGPKSKEIYAAMNGSSTSSGAADTADSSDVASENSDAASNAASSENTDISSENADANVTSNTSEDTSANQDNSLNPSSEKNLSDIIGVNGLSFAISGVSAVNNYTVAGVMDLTPREGDKFLEVDISCTNTTSNDIKVDFSQLNITYMCTFGGTTVYSSEALAPNGLSTFYGTIKAGASENLILLFDFSSDVLSGDLAGYQIKAKTSDDTYLVSF